MRIETHTDPDYPHVVHLDATETRAVARCLDSVTAWMTGLPEAARGRFLRDGDDRVRAAFGDAGSLGAFLGIFLPGHAPA